MIIIPKVEDQMIAKCPHCKTYFICSYEELEEDKGTHECYVHCPNDKCRQKISSYSCNAIISILSYIL